MSDKDSSLPSAEQMRAVLEHSPTAIIVSDIQDHRLIFANRLANKLFFSGKEEKEHYCYYLAGYQKECSFCQAEKMKQTELTVREVKHPVSGRTYRLSGKVIDWGGQPAHIEYIQDITEQKQEAQRADRLQKKLQEALLSIPCGLCVYQLDWPRIIPILQNARFCEDGGYDGVEQQSPDELVSILGVHPEDAGILREKLYHAYQQGGLLKDTCRLWDPQVKEYHWTSLDGVVKLQPDGKRLLYGVFTDISERVYLEKELTQANEKMQGIINAIPGGVAIYKVSEVFEAQYFSKGVPELSGFTEEEYREQIRLDAANMIYPDDAVMVVEKLQQAIRNHTVADLEFRRRHRNGNIVWVHVQAKQVGEADGFPLVQCVFHNISALKETQLELDHLINSIPGGIASYRVEGMRFVPTFYSKGVLALSGHTREEFDELVREDALNLVYERDRERVFAATRRALESDGELDISYRMRHRDGSLIWIHLRGRRIGPRSEAPRFYAVFTGISEEARLFQSIASEAADGIYVIDKENYDLLYVNEAEELFSVGKNDVGRKCYEALHNKNRPCEFCSLSAHESTSEEHELKIGDRTFAVQFRETDWGGIPAYIRFVRDVTKEAHILEEKNRLEQYFQTLVQNLPGGIAVVRHAKDGTMAPEYLSDGFAQMTGMTAKEAWELYCKDAMTGVYPEDQPYVREQISIHVQKGDRHWEMEYRLQNGSDGFLWVRTTFSMLQSANGESRVYTVFHDITKEREEKEKLRQQYNDLILQHYRKPGANALIVGHCNVTKGKILDAVDCTESGLLKRFSMEREDFFDQLSQFILDPKERQGFLQIFLREPALEAFSHGNLERQFSCFMQLPGEQTGRHVLAKMDLVATPDNSDVTGILTLADITEEVISNRILQQLSVVDKDFVADLDLIHDRYTVLYHDANTYCTPPPEGCHSQWMEHMCVSRVVPRDREQYRRGLEAESIMKRLRAGGAYTFSFSVLDDNGDIHTKNMTVSAIDLRLGRVCLSRADITDSIREQQGLLRVIADTFELAGFIDLGSRRFTMYTRESVLGNLPPYSIDCFEDAVESFLKQYGTKDNREEMHTQFTLERMTAQLEEQPAGYELLLPYQYESEERYKQITVLWGDASHKSICMVRVDVTEMLAAERQSKKRLEDALALAKEANRAKSDFLSSMSHDIRTPMNAIMGMTDLARAHMGDRERVKDCLDKISLSSRHLLSLINDVLDMSKIERSTIALNHTALSLKELKEQLEAMLQPQAAEAGLHLDIELQGVRHDCFYGDPLRINQVLINLVGNGLKFTPKGGIVRVILEETTPVERLDRVRYRFTVQDTGIGISAEFLAHIFEPFTRDSNAERIEGTGLGLSITKGLVDLMGGSISAESRIGEGTVFRVELEAEPAPEEVQAVPQQSDEETDEGLSGMRILVAEDNPINAEILCGLLELYGVCTVVRTDGAQAVSAFRDAGPGFFDAILMDIQMPRMNGYEATQAIRGTERADAETIPIIAMTANAFAEDVQAALDSGMNAHVAKPIDIGVLITTLRRIIGSKS